MADWTNPEVEIPCQACGGKMKKRLGDLRPGAVLKCRCGAETTCTGDDLRKVTESLRKLRDAMKRLGK